MGRVRDSSASSIYDESHERKVPLSPDSVLCFDLPEIHNPPDGRRRLLSGCGSDDTSTPDAEAPLSPRPRLDLIEMLREDVATPRHPTDGGGRAWLDEEASTAQPVAAGSVARFEIVYEAGPLGVSEDGMIFLQTSSFWGWSPPQDFDEGLPGFTEVSSSADDLELEIETLGGNLLAVHVGGRSLEPGEQIRFIYGAGSALARVDRYAEEDSPIWIAVDGDGDGVRSVVGDYPKVDISPAEPARLIAMLPSVARPATSVRLSISVVDILGNGGRPITTRLRLTSSPEGLELPEFVDLEPADRGAGSFEIGTPTTGVFRVLVESAEGLGGQSNPIFVTPRLPKILWADLHGHSELSDGTQTPDGYYRYARDVAGLDVIALTDHDHWGMRPLAQHPELWQSIQEAAATHNQPGRFVALAGFEWTNWAHGHRHVLYFSDGGRVLSSLQPEYEHPDQLWAALEGKPALTFAHHSAGEPVPTNWSVPPHPDLEPVTEIVSVHGSSEAMDSPGLIRGPVEGNFVRDALDRGYRLGFIGSGDSHDGHPGLAGIASPSSGLAALITEDLTRAGVHAALKQRRAYATNGPRILLHATLDGLAMGSDMPPAEGAGTHPLIA